MLKFLIPSRIVVSLTRSEYESLTVTPNSSTVIEKSVLKNERSSTPRLSMILEEPDERQAINEAMIRTDNFKSGTNGRRDSLFYPPQ